MKSTENHQLERIQSKLLAVLDYPLLFLANWNTKEMSKNCAGF
jgi:hypothetical protein